MRMASIAGSRGAVDVVVIGGGVAGATCAGVLASAGLDVVVVEREAAFRDRVRGEGIHPWGMLEVGKLGLDEVLHAAGAHDLPRWTTYFERAVGDSFRWDDDRPGWPGERTLYHPRLQTALLDHAAASGALVLRPARVTTFQPGEPHHLTVTTQDGTQEISARLVVGADGRASATRDWIGAASLADPQHHAIGGCLLEGIAADDTSSHMAMFAGGFVLLFPQGAGRARAYVICQTELAERLRGRANISAFIQQCADALPDGAVPIPETHAIGPLAFFSNANTWADRIIGDNIVLVGDAAGANDPSMGQGLSICFRDARELRDALLGESDWSSAIQQYSERRNTYFSVLCEHTRWMMLLTTETGPEADARRALLGRARELDPDAGGFSSLLANGPDGLVADEAARRHFFGEDLGDGGRGTRQ
jgi:menaquinone-9 beta-reductase